MLLHQRVVTGSKQTNQIMNRMIARRWYVNLCEHFSGKCDQNLSLFCGAVKPNLQTEPECWFLWQSYEIWFPKFTWHFWQFWHGFFKNVLESSYNFNPIKKRKGTFSLFETNVNGNVMTFRCTNVWSLPTNLPGMTLHVTSSMILETLRLSRLNERNVNLILIWAVI